MIQKLFIRRFIFFLVITLIPLSSLTAKGHSIIERTFLNKGDYFGVDGITYIVTYPIGHIVIDGKDEFIGDTGSAEVAYSAYSGEVIIPEAVTYGGVTYNVAGIARNAFKGCSELTSVTIPESATYIGDYAFEGCTGLTSVTLPESVKWSTESVQYSIGIGEYAFLNCTGLTSMTIPESVTSIGAGALYGCTGLTSMTIPESVTSIGAGAFYGCTGLTSMTIPESVTSIRTETFYGCTGLTSVTIPESVMHLGDYAFDGCTGLTSVTIPESVTSIGAGAFKNCSNLTLVTLNADAIVSAYYDYESSNNIVGKFGLQVRDYILGKGVQSIGWYAFRGATNLRSLTILANEMLSYSGFEGVTLSSATLHVPSTVLSAYRAEDSGWRAFGNIVSVSYYLKSKSGKYMAAGHDWGTRGIVNETGLDFITVISDDGKVSFDTGVSNGWDNHYLGSDLYMDAPSYAWVVEKTGADTYRIGNGTQYISVDAEDNLVMSDRPANWQFVLPEALRNERMAMLSTATEDSPVDVTWLLGNPGFNRNDQRVSAWQVSWDCKNKNLNGGNNVNNCAESYHSTFTISQTLSDIPAGTYELTAQGFYRQDAGLTEDDPVFFLGKQTKTLGEMGVLPDTNDNGKNDMSDASVAFSEGDYSSEPIYIFVGESESIQLGVKGTAKYQWVAFDNFRLMYMSSKMTNGAWESMKSEAETLAADDEAVAVGLLRDALAAAKAVTEVTDEDKTALKAAVDRFYLNNADLDNGQTAKVRYAQVKAELQALLNDADALYNDEYKTSGKEDFRQALQTAREVLESNKVTIPEVEAAIEALKNAVATFKTVNGADDDWVALKSEAETLAADDDAVAVGLLRDALATAKAVTIPTDEDRAVLQDAINLFILNNAELDNGQTAKNRYAQVKAELQALLNDADVLYNDEYKTNGKEEFRQALQTAREVMESNKVNIPEVEAAIEALRTAVNNFKAANSAKLNGTYYVQSADGKYMAAGHDWGTRGIVNETGLDMIVTTNSLGRVTLDTRVSNGTFKHFLGSDLYMDAMDCGWSVTKMNETDYNISNGTQYIGVDADDNLVLSDTPVAWKFVPAEMVIAERMARLSGASENCPVDITWMLGNPGFNRNDQRVSAWQVSEDCTNKDLNGGNNVNNCAESWHSTFTISQTLSNIPAGTYELTAQGFYRQDEGLTEDIPVFFLGAQTKSLAEMGVLPDTNDNGKNDMSDASVAFSEGGYRIEPIHVSVGEGESLTLGVRGTAKSQWVIFDNFRLTYLGTESTGPVNEAWEIMKSEAESLASDDDAVAVGLLRDALTEAYAVTEATNEDKSTLQAAINQFKQNNADVESDETAKVATNGWKKFDGSAANVCATQYAPAIDTYDGRTGVQLAEVFEGNGDRTGTIIYQDITGLTNGSYRVGFYANAFSTSGRDGFECTMADGAEDVAYVFANDHQAFIAAHIATSTTENEFREMDVEVTDGTIRLGMAKAEGKDKSTNWHTMQIYQLTWFTTAKTLYAQDKVTMSALIAEAQALSENPYKLNGKAELTEAISTAQTALENNRLNIAEFEAAIDALRSAVDDFNAVNHVTFDGTYYVRSADGKYMAAGHDWGTRGIVNETGLDLIAAVNGEGKVTLDSRVNNGGDNHYLGSNLYMDSSAYGWTVESINEMGYSISNGTQYIGVDADDNLVMSDTPMEWRFVRAEAVIKARMASLSGATESYPVDVTWMLGNPNFNRNDQRVSAWQVSEDCTNKDLNGGNNVNNCAESFHSTFTISQTLSNIPAGTYELTAQGFYRQDEGLTEDAPFFFLGTQVQTIDEMGVLPDANDNHQNDMNDASVAFSEGVYTIKPVRFFVNPEESLTLGVSGAATQQWVCFDNFRLTYLGQEDVTGITPLKTFNKAEELRNGKYMVNGRIVIVKNGKRYNVAGLRL